MAHSLSNIDPSVSQILTISYKYVSIIRNDVFNSNALVLQNTYGFLQAGTEENADAYTFKLHPNIYVVTYIHTHIYKYCHVGVIVSTYECVFLSINKSN